MSKVEQAKEALYGPNGLGVTNLKIFPGWSRNVTAEQVAEQVLTLAGELKKPGPDTTIDPAEDC